MVIINFPFLLQFSYTVEIMTKLLDLPDLTVQYAQPLEELGLNSADF